MKHQGALLAAALLLAGCSGIEPWVKDVINGTMLLVAIAAVAALRRRTDPSRAA